MSVTFSLSLSSLESDCRLTLGVEVAIPEIFLTNLVETVQNIVISCFKFQNTILRVKTFDSSVLILN